MTILAITSALLGAVFRWFLTVWILVPACALTFVIVFAGAAYNGHGLLRALLEFSVLATCLQVGYASHLLACVVPMWRLLKNPSNPLLRLRQ